MELFHCKAGCRSRPMEESSALSGSAGSLQLRMSRLPWRRLPAFGASKNYPQKGKKSQKKSFPFFCVFWWLIFLSVFREPLIDQRDDLIQRIQLQSLLFGDPPDEAIHTFDVLSAAKESTCCGRRFSETLSSLGIFFERNHVRVIGA